MATPNGAVLGRHALNRLRAAIRAAGRGDGHPTALAEVVVWVERLCSALTFAAAIEWDGATAVAAACGELSGSGDAA